AAVAQGVLLAQFQGDERVIHALFERAATQLANTTLGALRPFKNAGQRRHKSSFQSVASGLLGWRPTRSSRGSAPAAGPHPQDAAARQTHDWSTMKPRRQYSMSDPSTPRLQFAHPDERALWSGLDWTYIVTFNAAITHS